MFFKTQNLDGTRENHIGEIKKIFQGTRVALKKIAAHNVSLNKRLLRYYDALSLALLCQVSFNLNKFNKKTYDACHTSDLPPLQNMMLATPQICHLYQVQWLPYLIFEREWTSLLWKAKQFQQTAAYLQLYPSEELSKITPHPGINPPEQWQSISYAWS